MVDLTGPVRAELARALVLGLRTAAERGDPISAGTVEFLRQLTRPAGPPAEPARPAPTTMGPVTGTAAAAARLGCSTRHVRRLARAGRLPGARLVGPVWAIPEEVLGD